MLHTLNLHNVICQLYLKIIKDKIKDINGMVLTVAEYIKKI